MVTTMAEILNDQDNHISLVLVRAERRCPADVLASTVGRHKGELNL